MLTAPFASPVTSAGATRNVKLTPSFSADFKALDEAQLSHIVELQLAILQQRLVDRRITLTVTDAAKASLTSQGYDPTFGARPLKRLIQKEIGDRLAIAILEGKVAEGATVTVDATTVSSP